MRVCPGARLKENHFLVVDGFLQQQPVQVLKPD